MASTINKLCADAIVAGDMLAGAETHFSERCVTVRAEARKLRLDREKLRMILGPLAATYYTGAEWKKRGESWVFASGTAGEAAKKCVNRILGEVYGVNKRPDEEVPAELLRLAKALAKASKPYEHSKSLASKALALAFAK